MKKVKVDLQCPYCGFCKVLKTASYRKGITCPTCKQAIFLSWATGVEGELDNHGCYFHAYEPFNIRKINQEFQGAFDDYTPKPFTIRKRVERR
ncbi:TPA: hypothetical protein VCA04_001380 [Streptococcus suis]|nr:hypothetical protein [Streptococcus suis]HEM6182069.1 hypothetical protein [Streptococcus suis]HEP1783188.1 hypothetical protein [Streptococcus suis]